jgi:hypothetical protein
MQARAWGKLGRACARLLEKFHEEDILDEAWGCGEQSSLPTTYWEQDTHSTQRSYGSRSIV